MKKQRQIVKKVRRATAATPPAAQINTAQSNEQGDHLVTTASFGVLFLAAAAIVGGGYWSFTHFMSAFTSTGVQWTNLICSTVALAFTFIVARALLWLSFFGAAMLAAKLRAWKTLEIVTRRAIRFHKFIPNGSAWAATLLVQSLLGRGEYKEVLQVAEDEWKRSGEVKAQAQHVGPLCTAAATACQSQSDFKSSLIWNDRAIARINNVLEELAKPKKNILAKVSAVQAEQWTGQLKIYLTAAYFNNAMIHFNSNDLRRAKEHFKKAVEFAKDTPDFPNKSEMVKLSTEQLARLKHV